MEPVKSSRWVLKTEHDRSKPAIAQTRLLHERPTKALTKGPSKASQKKTSLRAVKVE